MDAAAPRTFVIDGRTIVVAGTTALEVVGGALAAPEVANALAGGVAVEAIVASLPAKQLTREDAIRLGEDERARFGSVAAMTAAGLVPSPFQNTAFVASLPTQAQLMAIVPHPSAMTMPSITLAPRAPSDNVTLHPPYVAPIDSLRLPAPGAPGGPGHAGPLTTPNTGPGDIGELDTRYPITATTVAGTAALASIEQCRNPDGSASFQVRNSFGALKNAMEPYEAGWKAHHIVEQSQIPKFGSRAIQNTANIIALPDAVHDVISAQYSRAFEDAAGHEWSHYRDYMQSQPYDRQRALGLDAVEKAVDVAEKERRITPAVADKLRADLKKLDRPEICAPVPKIDPQDLLPSIPDLNQRIDDHNQQNERRLPSARSVAEWDGSTRSGTFLDVGGGRVAQHQGLGDYAIADVQKQLGGVMPPIGQYVTLQQNGQVQVPQQGHSLGMQLG